jgi:hypothetical protein
MLRNFSAPIADASNLGLGAVSVVFFWANKLIASRQNIERLSADFIGGFFGEGAKIETASVLQIENCVER